MHATLPLLRATDFPAIRRKRLQTLQVNLGYKCNQSCLHCHVNAGPTRTETMSGATLEVVREFIRASGITTLDITGGAPEMHAAFRPLVLEARARKVHVIDRCNLTVLEEPGHEDLAHFLADHEVEIIASMPCYSEGNVNAQRGDGVFEKSIQALQRLNSIGYGHGGALKLSLVYNPQGPSLPPAQSALEVDYKRELGNNFGIVFDQLFTLANMPIQRFGSTLVSKGQFEPYMKLLRANHRDENVENVMCRTLLSVDWQGYVYDCDFNQMLGLPLAFDHKPKLRLVDLMGRDLSGNAIAVADHCYGCTAGQGSSCGGALDH